MLSKKKIFLNIKSDFFREIVLIDEVKVKIQILYYRYLCLVISVKGVIFLKVCIRVFQVRVFFSMMCEVLDRNVYRKSFQV